MGPNDTKSILYIGWRLTMEQTSIPTKASIFSTASVVTDAMSPYILKDSLAKMLKSRGRYRPKALGGRLKWLQFSLKKCCVLEKKPTLYKTLS